MAEPQYLQLMPGPSPWPISAAVFTASFFLLLTIQAYAFAAFSGIGRGTKSIALAVGDRPTDTARDRRYWCRDRYTGRYNRPIEP